MVLGALAMVVCYALFYISTGFLSLRTTTLHIPRQPVLECCVWRCYYGRRHAAIGLGWPIVSDGAPSLLIAGGLAFPVRLCAGTYANSGLTVDNYHIPGHWSYC